MNIGTARSLSLEAGARSIASPEMLDQAAVLSRREATLRSAATTCLVGHRAGAGDRAAVPARAGKAARPSCRWRRWRCASGSAWRSPPRPPAPRASSGARSPPRTCWCSPAGPPRTCSRSPASPATAASGRRPPGVVSAALAVACLVVAAVAAPPTRASLRGLLTTAAVVIALAPGAGVLLVSLGPGTFGGETVLAAGAHIHSHGSFENAIVFQALPGGKGGHYVYKASAAPHQTTVRGRADRRGRTASSSTAWSGTCAGASRRAGPRTPTRSATPSPSRGSRGLA